jgi:ubiquinone/menaquinone biosynthesis C-methylase UbiE
VTTRVQDDPFEGGTGFRAIGEHVRENYLRFDYAKGTKQEARFLRDALAELPADARVLDVACGVGRHEPLVPWHVVGVDLTRGLLEVARDTCPTPKLRYVSWVQADARALPLRPASFDAAWSLCEGAFGLLPDDAAHVRMLREVHAALKPGAPFVLSAMSVFAMVHDEHFDLATNVMTDVNRVKSPTGETKSFRLSTRAFAPREVLAMGRAAGFEAEHLWGGVTGAYERRALRPEDPEMLVFFRKPR